jgi:hypothetical protein
MDGKSDKKGKMRRENPFLFCICPVNGRALVAVSLYEIYIAPRAVVAGTQDPLTLVLVLFNVNRVSEYNF